MRMLNDPLYCFVCGHREQEKETEGMRQLDLDMMDTATEDDTK